MLYTIKCNLQDMIKHAVDKTCDILASGNANSVTFNQLNKESASTSSAIFEVVRYLSVLHRTDELKELYKNKPEELRTFLKNYFAANYHKFSYDEYLGIEQQSVQDLAFKIDDINTTIMKNTSNTTYLYLVNKQVATNIFYDPYAIIIHEPYRHDDKISAYNVTSMLKKAGIEYTNGKVEVDFHGNNLYLRINETEFAFAISPLNVMWIIDKDIQTKKEQWTSGNVSAESGFSYPTIALYKALNKHGFKCKHSRSIMSSLHYSGKEEYNPMHVARSAILHNYYDLNNKMYSIIGMIRQGKYNALTVAKRGKIIRKAFENCVQPMYTPNMILGSDKYEECLMNTDANPEFAWLFAYYKYVNELIHVVAETFTQLSLLLPYRIYNGETYTDLLKRKK